MSLCGRCLWIVSLFFCTALCDFSCSGRSDGLYCSLQTNFLLIRCLNGHAISNDTCEFGCRLEDANSTQQGCNCRDGLNCSEHGSCLASLKGKCLCDDGFAGERCNDTNFCTYKLDGIYCSGER